MHDPMAGLDAWLESPYTNRAREEAAFEAWCVRKDVDPDDSDAWDRFEEDMAAEQEDAEIAAGEARADARREDPDW